MPTWRSTFSLMICVAAAAATPLLWASDAPAVEKRRFEPAGSEMVLVPPGSYEVGCVAGDDECYPDEKPRHTVTLRSGLWIDVTEVTLEQYRAFARAEGRSVPAQPPWSRGDHPVVNVTWDDAVAYCTWAGGRLPTEAEWEIAARGLATGTRYPWGDTASHEFANYEGADARDRWNQSAPVASFEPNGLGLHDMIGNVWEWCADWYDLESYAAGDADDPQGPSDGTMRVLRGGSWNYAPRSLRLSNRGRLAPDGHTDFIGFRCARDVGAELVTPTPPPPAPAEGPAPSPTVVSSPVATPPPSPPAQVATAVPQPEAVATPFPTAAATPAPTTVATAAPAAPIAVGPARGTVRRFPHADTAMAWIPPSTVEIGCVRGDGDCDGDEQPRHAVTFADGFWIAVTEVTVASFRAFAEATGRAMPHQPEWSADDHPVVNVTWDDAAAYCGWAGGRLPTEAEWEAAARGGVAGMKYVTGRRLDPGKLNADGVSGADSFGKTAPVGSFEPNGFGLLDIAGNVWEWCADWYAPRAYSEAGAVDPRGPDEGSLRVVRGGSWTSNAWRLRLSYRFRLAPSETSVTLGFRCVRDTAAD